MALLVALVGASVWMQEGQLHGQKTKEPVVDIPSKEPPKNLKRGSLTPGRVMELKTARGVIEFVLFEKDCPVTTKRIVDLALEGCYDGNKFSRVEEWVIQTDLCKKKVKPFGLEIREGLVHAKGAVGMARTDDPNSHTSSFYVVLEPQPSLNYQYTVFGRLIRGMDVAMRIRAGDLIRKARVRPLSAADRKRFFEILRIEAERRTD